MISLIGLGIVAGTAPSPHTLFSLEVALRNGFRDAMRSNLMGLLFDVTLVSVLYFIGRTFAGVPVEVFRALSLVGGFLLLRSGAKLIRAKPRQGSPISNLSGVSLKALRTQSLNPNPYIFWGMIGIPMMLQPQLIFSSIFVPLVFLASTYACKTLWIFLTSWAAEARRDKVYAPALVACGLLQCGVAISFIAKGIF